MNCSIFLGSFASVFLLRGNLRRLREKIDNIFRDQNVSDCEEEDVLEINNFELIDLDEIEEIQGATFKGNLLKTPIIQPFFCANSSLISFNSFYPFPSSIYSCSIGLILKHEFCHLGCWAVLWKISETTKILLKYATF